MKTITLISLSSIILFSCAPNVPTNSNDLTLGAVQSKIYKGQSQSEVMDVLGSPNIVTKDTQGSLTVIITFDDKKNVLDFTYQSLKY